MSTELAPISGNDDLRALVAANDVTVSKTSSKGFLPFIKLCTSSTNEGKTGAIPVNNYGLFLDRDNPEDLGKEVSVFIAGRRPKAVDTKAKPIVSSYDDTSDVYIDIAKRSTIKDSGCMAGIEFLLWLDTRQIWVTMHLSGKSGEISAQALLNTYEAWKKGSVKVPTGTLSSKYIDGEKFQWYAVKFNQSVGCVSYPTAQDMIEMNASFNKPVMVELPEAAPAGEERAR